MAAILNLSRDSNDALCRHHYKRENTCTLLHLIMAVRKEDTDELDKALESAKNTDQIGINTLAILNEQGIYTWN